MPRKPAHEQFDTLAAIREQAFELFGRFGYEGVSIGDIAAAARLSKGALYWHFPGKEALFLDCLQRLHAIFEEYVFTPMQQEPDPVRSVWHIFSGVQRLLEDPRVAHGVAGYWLIPSSPETAPFIQAQRSFELRSQQVIAQTLRKGVEAGAFDLGDDLEDMARAIISVLEAVVLPLRHMTKDEVARNTGVLARTLFRAYAPEVRRTIEQRQWALP